MFKLLKMFNSSKVRSSLKPIQIKEKTMNQEVQSAVGRWGEEFAYEYLKATETRPNAEVIWINGVEETGQPYDVFFLTILNFSNFQCFFFPI